MSVCLTVCLSRESCQQQGPVVVGDRLPEELEEEDAEKAGRRGDGDVDRDSLKDSRRALLVSIKMSSKRDASSRSNFQTRMGRPMQLLRYESIASMQ